MISCDVSADATDCGSLLWEMGSRHKVNILKGMKQLRYLKKKGIYFRIQVRPFYVIVQFALLNIIAMYF
jgi:hypothetical protein